MHWLSRLFKIKTSTERLQELQDEICARRQREVSDVVSRIDQALQSAKLMRDEVAKLNRSRKQIASGYCLTIRAGGGFDSRIEDLWRPQVHKEEELYDIRGGSKPFRGLSSKPIPRSSTKKREWALALTDEFVKSTCGIDRKLQGRILEALHLIASAPTSPRGDTVKALTGDLAGLWRFRVGDFRLIYKPDEPTMRIYLLSFGGRGAVYH